MTDITQILNQIENGDPNAASDLLPLVYAELRKLASAKLSQEKAGQTLQPTALVHEAYLRLVHGKSDQDWGGRRHFFGAAAEAMRRILIDNARRKKTNKAGGDRQRVEFEDVGITLRHAPEDLLTLDDAIEELLADDPMAGELAKLRLFAGLSVEDAAQALNVSRRSGFRLWTYGRAFLQLRFQSSDPDSATD